MNFQRKVDNWMRECFGFKIASNKIERNYRFLEESLELVQSCGCTFQEAHTLVDYVYGRPIGVPIQELGGVMVTLAALATANHMHMADAGTFELTRISDPKIMQRIREKQKGKNNIHSPLP